MIFGSAALAACSSGSESSPASPSVEALRPVAACPATTRVPADLVRVAPSATLPPTSVVATGEALGLAVTPGARVGLAGAASSGSGPVLCRGRSSSASLVTLVALRPGYDRVAVARDGRPDLRVFVKVTV